MHAHAETLWTARIKGSPCAPLTETDPTLTLEGAYAISRACFERRLATGERSIGRKIGLTSHAVQKQLGVEQPDFGFLTSAMIVNHDHALPAGSLIQGKVEGEVAFVLGRELKGHGMTRGVTREDVIHATDHVLACIEIIDSRVRDWKIKIQDTVADNASSAFFVLGTKPRRLDAIDLRMAGMTLRLNGEVESTGVGAACMGHPIDAVVWLANTLGRLGDSLKAGDIILSGAYGPVVPFRPGDHCEVEISELGKVRCTYDRPRGSRGEKSIEEK